jgi:hypothetical protein
MEQTCFTHPTRQALSFCHSCGRYFCSDCLVESEEFYYCRDETCQNEQRQEKVRIPSEPDEQAGNVSFFKRVAKLCTWFWPRITDADSAKKASRQGYWACALIAGTKLLLVVLGLLGSGLLSVNLSSLDEVLAFITIVLAFIIIGWGIYKMNRFAAVAGTLLYLFYIWILIWTKTEPGPFGVESIICLMFVNSVRGTLEYHKYRKETGSTTIV